MANKRTTIGVGVATFNNSAEQQRNLSESLSRSAEVCFRQTGRRCKLYVIDNGQKTNLNPENVLVKYLETMGNVGYSTATNALMHQAFDLDSLDYFITLNPDTHVHCQAITNLLALAAAAPDCLVEGHQFPDEHPKPYDFNSRDTPWASGACLLIPRQIYQEIGSFDPNFFLYMEDVDYSWRARMAGRRVLHCAEALIGHQTGDRPASKATVRHQFEAALYLALKWHDESFANWVKEQLKTTCGLDESAVNVLSIATAKRVERLGPSERIAQLVAKAHSDFSHYFFFSEPRW